MSANFDVINDMFVNSWKKEPITDIKVTAFTGNCSTGYHEWKLKYWWKGVDS